MTNPNQHFRAGGTNFIRTWVRIVFLLFSLAATFPKPARGQTNLILNGDFEMPDPAHSTRPAYWDLPDGLGIVWTTAPPNRAGTSLGKAIRMDTRVSEKALVAQWRRKGITQWDIPQPADNSVAATYGLSFYSTAIPVASGQAYRISFDLKAPQKGEGAKVWVRCYGRIRGELRRRYETVVNCRAPDTEWTRFSHVFFPSRYRSELEHMRVMLYAYWPPGVYWFDNIRLEPISVGEYERLTSLQEP